MQLAKHIASTRHIARNRNILLALENITINRNHIASKRKNVASSRNFTAADSFGFHGQMGILDKRRQNVTHKTLYLPTQVQWMKCAR